MTIARPRAIAILLFALCAAGMLVLLLGMSDASSTRPSGTHPSGKHPQLLLLTSLPLVFSEDFSLEHAGSPALQALQSHYRVVPINLADRAELAKGHFLLMAQPDAQAPDNLVALDNWVRRGGRLILLADPLLEWPSKLPLGNPARPPPMFVDTGLLAHWGLRLDSPDERGPALRDLAGSKILTVSPGALFGSCPISSDRLVARCRIGSGEAIIIADADFLNVSVLGSKASPNLPALLKEIASAESSQIR